VHLEQGRWEVKRSTSKKSSRYAALATVFAACANRLRVYIKTRKVRREEEKEKEPKSSGSAWIANRVWGGGGRKREKKTKRAKQKCVRTKKKLNAKKEAKAPRDKRGERHKHHSLPFLLLLAFPDFAILSAVSNVEEYTQQKQKKAEKRSTKKKKTCSIPPPLKREAHTQANADRETKKDTHSIGSDSSSRTPRLTTTPALSPFDQLVGRSRKSSATNFLKFAPSRLEISGMVRNTILRGCVASNMYNVTSPP
jgi:hypothetical protein